MMSIDVHIMSRSVWGVGHSAFLISISFDNKSLVITLAFQSFQLLPELFSNPPTVAQGSGQGVKDPNGTQTHHGPRVKFMS